jgi:hypothetical protein
VFTIRRKYAAGGDVWIADAETEAAARENARVQSENFEHGAVYVLRGSGPTAEVAACYCLGYPTSWVWWNTPNILTFRLPVSTTGGSVFPLNRPRNF